MAWADKISSGKTNLIKKQWDTMHKLPGGKLLFSKAVGLAAPYTGTISAHVDELREGYSRVTMADRRGVRNHLKSVHAIALVNLAELAGNVALAYSLPDDARFIVSGLSIQYIKKARGTITAESESPMPKTSEKQEYDVPVVMKDKSGDVVAKATLKSLVGPKSKA